MLTLIALNGQEKGREFQLTGEQPMLIGRQASELQLSDSQTSRRHAEILLENNTWLIRDLGSTNGTWVNGQKIAQITELEPGDRIVMGRHQFRIGKITDVPAPSPKPKPSSPEPVIGSEELAEMSVDLGESLSADILDDDDLPTLPDDSIEQGSVIDTHKLGGTQTSADNKPAELTGGPGVTKSPDKPGVDDDILDLDALLGDDLPAADTGPDASEQSGTLPTVDTSSQSHAPDSVPAETPEASQADEPSGLPDEDGLIDLDALLEENPEPPVPPVPPASPEFPEADQVSEAPLVSEDSQEQGEELPEPTGEVESDELIDFDILASAEPTTTFHVEQQGPEQEDVTVSDPPDEPAIPPTVSAPPVPPDVPTDIPPTTEDSAEEVIEEPGDEVDEIDEPGDPDEEPATDSLDESDDGEAPVLTGSSSDADQPDPPDPELQDELEPDEKALLMSPDEQSEALAGYKRSRVKTLMVLVLILAGVGAAIYFTVDKYTRSAETKPSQTRPVTLDQTSAPPGSGSPKRADDPLSFTAGAPPVTGKKTQDSDTLVDDTDVFFIPADQSPPQEIDTPTPPPAMPPTPEVEEALTPKQAPELSPAAEDGPATDAGVQPPAVTSMQNAPALDAPEILQPLTLREPGETSGVTGHTRLSPTVTPQALTVQQTPESPAVPDPELKLLSEAVDAQFKGGVADQAVFAGARRVAFIVDASGSLVDSFPYILTELGGAMSDLPEDSAFTIIFFGSEGVVEVPPVGLRWADQQTKRRVRRWITPASGNISAWGRGDPFAAIQQALTYPIDEVCILSDNLFGQRISEEEAQASVNRIVELLDGKVTRVHVIQFFDRDPHQVLKQIAQAFEGRLERVEPQVATRASGTDPLSSQ